MKLYRIKNWNLHFENNKSRERERCSFCCVPNKQDGLGYGMLLRQPEGEALYGAFVAVALVCSKQKKRAGWITADGLPAGCPLSARQLSVKCQFTEKTIQSMLDICASDEIDWIEVVEVKSSIQKEVISEEIIESARQVPAECPPSALERKKERRERKKEHTSSGDDDDGGGFDVFWKAYPKRVGKWAARKKWGRLEMSPELLQAILAAIKAQSTTEQWTKDGGRFIPHPVTWLNQERWNDEPFLRPQPKPPVRGKIAP